METSLDLSLKITRFNKKHLARGREPPQEVDIGPDD